MIPELLKLYAACAFAAALFGGLIARDSEAEGQEAPAAHICVCALLWPLLLVALLGYWLASVGARLSKAPADG